MSERVYKVALTIERVGDFYEAAASIRQSDYYLSDPFAYSGKCRSRDEKRALSYALSELAVAIGNLSQLP